MGRKEPFRKGRVLHLPELGFTLVWTGQGAGWHRSKDRPLLTAFSWDLKTSREERSWSWLGKFGDLTHGLCGKPSGSKMSSLSTYPTWAHEDPRGASGSDGINSGEASRNWWQRRQRRRGGCRVAGGKLWCSPGQWQSQCLGLEKQEDASCPPTAGEMSMALRCLLDRVLREQAQWTYGCWAEGIVREVRMGMYTLLYSGWITKKDLLYSTGASAQLCGSLDRRGVWGRIET